MGTRANSIQAMVVVAVGAVNSAGAADATDSEKWNQPWLDSSLFYLTVAIVALVIARIVLALARLLIRRRYNLTFAETAPAKEHQSPSFLQVDARSRDNLVAQATTFDQRKEDERQRRAASAPSVESPDGLDFYAKVSRFLSIVVAIVTLATSVVGAAASVELFDSVGQRFSGWDRFSELVQTHWIGAGIVVLVILIEIYRFFCTLRQPDRR